MLDLGGEWALLAHHWPQRVSQNVVTCFPLVAVRDTMVYLNKPGNYRRSASVRHSVY